MGIKGDIIAVGIAGAVLLAAGWYAKKKLAVVAQVAVPYVNPTDPRNLAYTGVNAVGSVLTGDSGFTLGGWIYDITHPTVAHNSAPVVMGPLPYDFGIINPSEGW